jgi:GR25 family glycosyltransferase involved in LPS biosynthesis
MIPVYIMAVPWDVARMKRANDIRKTVNGTIVLDQTKNVMDTFRLLLGKVVEDGDQAFVIMQDDIQLASDWREKAEALIAERPDQVNQFFAMESEANAKAFGSRECKGDTFISNLCVYFPAGYASQLLDYSFEFVEKYEKYKTADDFVVRYWLRNRKENYYLHYPNLVQHESWVSSINSKRPRNRRSHFWDGE